MRPSVRFLDQSLIDRIVAEARELLCTLGVQISNPGVLSLLGDNGARVDQEKQRAYLTPEIIDKSLATVPRAFKLYDTKGNEAVDFSGEIVNFTPGSTAINILDHGSLSVRRPNTADYVRYTKLMASMEHVASQSTAMVAADVHERISDSYRLYLSLLYCDKPVITGAFTASAFEIMKNLQLAVRGSANELAAKPLTVFSCCPTSPLKWCDVTSQNLVDCANHMIPVEYVAMPLSGFMAPVTLVGSLVQHTAETLSGVAISQLTRPGAPALYGGSPAVFDVRYETTPMGAVGTMMMDCAYSEIGKYLGFPTQAYIGLSDAKLLDAQAGFETSMGATLAGLAGINNVAGPGMMDFENCFSLEKLVLDNEICGMVRRMVRGIQPKEDFPSLPRFQELLAEDHLLISEHTMKYLHDEVYFPGPVVERANRPRWQEEGSSTLGQRAHAEVERLIDEWESGGLDKEVRSELTDMMATEARKFGMDKLPELP